MSGWRVYRDGELLVELDAMTSVMGWFHRHVAHCSMAHALQHEGYSYEENREGGSCE